MRGGENSIVCQGKEDKLIRGAQTQLNSLARQHVLITNSIIRKGHSEACEGFPYGMRATAITENTLRIQPGIRSLMLNRNTH